VNLKTAIQTLQYDRIGIAYFSVMDGVKTSCQAYAASSPNSIWSNHFRNIYVPFVAPTA